MAEQEKKRKSKTDPNTQEEARPKTKTGDKLKEDVDNLLDEIDEVLEENAEEFVKNYVQKGGQ